MSNNIEKLKNNGFDGTIYRTTDSWTFFLPLSEYENKSINYLEIGGYYGSNVITVAETYGKHKDSILHVIDPWIWYDDYSEYENKNMDTIYSTFLKNTEKYREKIKDHRGFSNNELLKFEDNYFDIIYIDGNHDPEYVLEDAVLSFRKLKKNGILIFDDFGWRDVNIGIFSFIDSYRKKIGTPLLNNFQLFLSKL